MRNSDATFGASVDVDLIIASTTVADVLQGWW